MLGLVTLDCDKIARQVVEPGKPGFEKIVDLFGQKVVRNDSTLDRAALRNTIVNDSKMRKKMENILHPQILKEMVFQMENAVYDDKKAVAVEVPLLFESGMETNFDVTIAVAARDKDLVHRICSRDSVKKKDAQKMVALQMSQNEKTQRADHVITNNGTRDELFDLVDNLFDQIAKEFLTR